MGSCCLFPIAECGVGVRVSPQCPLGQGRARSTVTPRRPECTGKGLCCSFLAAGWLCFLSSPPGFLPAVTLSPNFNKHGFVCRIGGCGLYLREGFFLNLCCLWCSFTTPLLSCSILTQVLPPTFGSWSTSLHHLPFHTAFRNALCVFWGSVPPEKHSANTASASWRV